ncbi:MAG TPA: ROK family transcriptional regulator [Clostridiaceae bacterium]|nr:ROK family transcriptional regulator [Clostridiaceae bacterium]
MGEKQTNNHEVKKINRNLIYRYVCKYGRVSKPDIAKALGLSMPTVLQNIKELMDWGLICEEGVFESTGGRKAKVIAPVYNIRYAIGIDITKNHIGFALTDLSGSVLIHTRQYKPFVNERQYYFELGEMAEAFLNKSGIPKDRFLGFGISIPGIVDSENEIITFSHALGITNVPCSMFSQFLPYPCIFTNDANAALIAEMYRISDRSPTVCLSLSNSVGGAIFYEKSNGLEGNPVNDSLYHGDNCRSGEFGHMTLIPGGKVCYCGKVGCLDSYCSAKVLSELTDGKLERFFKELENGNEKFAQVWEEYLSNLAIAANNLRMAFDCQVIIGGYVGSFIEPYLSYLREKAAALNTFENNALYIKPCHYKIEASALGAAIRHVEAFIYTI